MENNSSKETQTYYERVKQGIIETARKWQATNTQGGNQQTAENLLNHLEEYTIRLITFRANEAARHAQHVSDTMHSATYNAPSNKIVEGHLREFKNGFITCLPQNIQDALYKRVAGCKGKHENIEEEIRQAIFQASGVPEQYRLPTYEELKNAEESLQKLQKDKLENWDNYSYRRDCINAEIDYLKLRMYVEGSIPGNDPSTSEYYEHIRSEKIAELEEEFRQKETVGKAK